MDHLFIIIKKLSHNFRRVGQKEVMNFTHQLSTLLNAGLELDRSLEILVELNNNPKFKNILANVRKNVHSGSSFADAVGRHPRIFSRLYVNMVNAGEAGGVLELTMLRLAGFLESAQELKDYIISSLIYPFILLVVGGGAVGILMTYVIPRFSRIFYTAGYAIPLPAQILMALSEFINEYWWLIISLLVISVIVTRSYKNTKMGTVVWDTYKLHLPVLGNLIRKLEMARFARTLGTLLKNGVPVLQALSIVKDIIQNQIIAESLEKVIYAVRRGAGISSPLREGAIFPPFAIHMITVGEETGKLEDMLLKVADTYDSEVKSSIRRLISMFEPFLVVIMGLIVGFIVLSMLMAIFSIHDLPI